jgi:hypothetical protein
MNIEPVGSAFVAGEFKAVSMILGTSPQRNKNPKLFNNGRRYGMLLASTKDNAICVPPWLDPDPCFGLAVDLPEAHLSGQEHAMPVLHCSLPLQSHSKIFA